jgi:hypothetical protein
MLKVSREECATIAQLLNDYDTVCDGIDSVKQPPQDVDESTEISLPIGGAYTSVGLDREVAADSLAAQRAFIERRLSDYGIEII